MQAWVVIIVAFVYLILLFAVASYGDRKVMQKWRRGRTNIYALSLAIYCTTWTFFGSVGLAASSGINFLAIYLGPILVITVGYPVFRRIVRLSKEQRITSIADFLGARYGKSMQVAAVATVIAVIGTVPYIALQLKAISSSVTTLISHSGDGSNPLFFGDITILIAVTLAVFSILFGTRHADATEHQDGLMLAIAMESFIKLAAFVCVGIFTVYFIFDGFGDLFTQGLANPDVQNMLAGGINWGQFLVYTSLSLIVFLLLPRQFHVAVVENHTASELRRARWLFPLYLVIINLFVIPIALAGMIKFGTSISADDFVLILPMSQSDGLASNFVSLFAFVGGLSAGTAMVVVACVALAIMLSNDLILPIYLRSQATIGKTSNRDMEVPILNIRRGAIVGVLTLAYFYYSLTDNTIALASIGLISFVAIAQLGPAFFGGLFWKQANARGAMIGMISGFCVWGYTLLLPTLLTGAHPFVSEGLFGIAALRPQNLFGFDMAVISNGMIWSLFFNTLGYVAGSMSRSADPLERMQASAFVSRQSSRSDWNSESEVTVLQLRETVGRYLGTSRTMRAFDDHWATLGKILPDGQFIDNELLRFSEQLLASAIGASSSRLVHSLLLKRYGDDVASNLRLLDQASEAIQFNRGVLQSALDQLDQGLTVFDDEFRLASWNTQFRSLLNLPTRVVKAGAPLAEITKEIIALNSLDDFDPGGEQLAYRLVNKDDSWHFDLPGYDKILEIKTSAMPAGGIVVTWNDITQRLRSAEALREANESLERRVEERTSDLMELNEQLKIATAEADTANRSKTRFLAAAGHDILQPLNAARLYSSTLLERLEHQTDVKLAQNMGKSLESVEDILGAILAISRLDTAQMNANPIAFPLQSVLEQLKLEFTPIALEKGLHLEFDETDDWVHSDPGQLRRLLQNLISNGIKYTTDGGVSISCKKMGNQLSIKVSDTGMGIAGENLKIIFTEFERLEEGAKQATGLGLGLSIVERIADLLGHEVVVKSQPGEGTDFEVRLNIAKADVKSAKLKPPPQAAKTIQLAGSLILCLDNDTNILEGMSNLLTQWGCDVIIATDVAIAEEVMANGDQLPDIILADYHLNRANGIDAIIALRSKFDESLPAVLVTADRSEEIKARAIKIGLPILHKPIKPAALRAVIAQERISREAAE